MTTGKKNISSPAEPTLVVGATSSLAQALCRELARRGHALILAGRDVAELELLAADLSVRHGTECRVLTADMVANGFSAADFVASAGEFAQAVIAVGDMGGGIAGIARVNYIVPAEIAAACAEALGIKKHGIIAIIGSVAGDRGRQSNYVYGSAKAALATFASGLRNRYAAFGVHVLTVKPGFVDTPMTWGMKSPLIAGREYVARKIADAMEKRKDVIYVPWFWRWIMLVIRSIPERVFKRLSL